MTSIFTKKKNELILNRVKHARTFTERFLGLMMVSPREHDYALVFHMHDESKIGASIHMLFMKMPIDVLFLDAQKKIVDFTTLKPWAINYTPVRAAKYVIELPAGTLPPSTLTGLRVQWK